VIDPVLLPNPLQSGLAKPAAMAKRSGETGSASPFAQLLGTKLPGEAVKFSQHAQERLVARGISLSESQLQKLQGAVENVAGKGGKESLIMVGDAALVVSIKNRTVITAMDRSSMAGNVFTNIDSAVVL